jgi:hypothetical protein
MVFMRQKIAAFMKIIYNELPAALRSDLPPENLKKMLLAGSTSQRKKAQDTQLSLFANYQPALATVQLQH